MTYKNFFEGAANRDNSAAELFTAAIEEAELFVGAAEEAELIDDSITERLEKINYRIHTFKMRGPASDIRYANRSILSGTWSDAAKTKKGIIEPRRKLYDYYLRLTQDRNSALLRMEFTVMGLGRHVKELGGVQPIELEKMDRRKTNPFFKGTARLMTELAPFIIAKAERYTAKLDRLTGPKGVQ